MPAIEIGRICVKVAGREAGRKCVVVDIVDENFVIITGPKSLTGVRRRKTNIKHIEPTDKIINIPKGAGDEDVLKAIGASGLTDFMTQAVKPKLSPI
ncbi:MAG: 50S ribosomal protein L14e [Thermosphaera sp.]